jgi:hypothetical protein
LGFGKVSLGSWAGGLSWVGEQREEIRADDHLDRRPAAELTVLWGIAPRDLPRNHSVLESAGVTITESGIERVPGRIRSISE